MDGYQLDEAVRMLRAAIATGVSVQKTLELFPEEYRQVIFTKYSLENQEIIRVEVAVLHNKARRSWQPKTNDGIAWRKLKQYLIDHIGRTQDELDSLDHATDKILEQLADPNEEGDNLEPVKGLVIGYVQSGKTANYTALAAKAFDSGYKIVIVLSGIHKSLRRQTQIRMNDELGIPGSGKARISAKNFPPVAVDPITSMTNEDLDYGDAQYTGVSSHVLQGKVLFVVKKNTAVLERLITWLGESERVEHSTLIIDDEADQASINTGGNRYESDDPLLDQAAVLDHDVSNPDEPEEAPAVINSKVRRLVKLFRNVSYVGYTATPYANVFIDHEAVDKVAGDDLYPKDFILSLPKPLGYFGPEELFEQDLQSELDGEGPSLASKVIEIVPDLEVGQLHDLLTNPNVDETRHNELPESLKRAIRTFVLATAAYCSAKGQDNPTALLIHTTSSKGLQNILSGLVEKHLRVMQREWRYDSEVAEGVWRESWEAFATTLDGSDYPHKYEDIYVQLDRLLSQFGEVNVLTLNSDSTDELDYQYQPFGASIVVGGNKLSRGLTIEGLLISYFTRKATDPKADTLTQMGRFFGHRKPTIALSRIFTTTELRTSFQEIALVEASLRDDIKRYEKLNLRPIDFAPRVLRRAHLMPTARNKMGVASEHGNSYAGELIQTSSFPDDSINVPSEWGEISRLEKNFKATCSLVSSLGDPEITGSADSASKLVWRNVGVHQIVNYLKSYSGVDDATRFVPARILAYIEDLIKGQETPELTNWTVVIIGKESAKESGSESFGMNWNVGRITRALDAHSLSSIGTLVTPLGLSTLKDGSIRFRGDELEDISKEEIESLVQPGLRLEEFRPGVRALRDKENGLLLIYPVSPDSIGTTPGKNNIKKLGEALFKTGNPMTVVGLAMVFPSSDVEIKPFYQGKAGNNNG
jgi:hypothetical protein